MAGFYLLMSCFLLALVKLYCDSQRVFTHDFFLCCVGSHK